MTPDLQAMGQHKFVSLTTYRKDGTPVATPVWVASTPEGLVVTTPAGSHKVKRLRRRPEASVQPCSRRGAVEPGAPEATARVEIIEPADVAGTAAATPGAVVEVRRGVPRRARHREADDPGPPHERRAGHPAPDVT